jgi:cytochrome b6-f complex iron-sulfur subunit
MQRRNFLGWLTWIAGTALGGFILYPVARYIVPPSIPEAVTRRVLAAKKNELSPGNSKTFAFGSQPGLLVRTADGGYRAYSAVCTHLGCTVQYKSDERVIWCACHNGRYDLEGRNVSGPPPRPLEVYVVHEEGDDIIVEKAGAA